MAASSLSSSDEQFEPGSVLDGRYRVEGVLGTGGMGRVYRAEHTKIGKSVAIKVLHADLGRNREASQRFQREAIASGRLDHPNIVGVSDFGVLDGGACYLVMELLEGESLGDRLTRDTRLPWTEAIDILRGVLYGLRHAHERGVVHRDIKPDNVYLARKDGDPVIKILDFGIAKLYAAGRTEDPAATRAGLTVGTPAYLSPEQAVGGEITPASDLYSATVVLYEMLVGRAPFEDKDPVAMLGAHVGRQPPSLAVIAPELELPPRLEAIVERGLVKLAAQRIGTAAEYLALLDAVSPPHPPRVASAPEASRVRSYGDAHDAPAPRTRGEPVIGPGTGQRVGAGPSSGALAPVAARDAAAGGGPGTPSSGAAIAAGPPDRAAAPVIATPLPTTAGALAAAPVSLVMTPAPRAIRAVSLAEVGEPIPLAWIVRSGVLAGLVVVVALVLAIGTHCTRTPPSPGAATVGAPGPGSARPVDRDAPLGALLRELERGKTCAARAAPIEKLVELRDPRAVPVLKRARDRTGSGDDSNACLKADAERALKALASTR